MGDVNEAKTNDQIMDEILDEEGMDTPSDSSSENKPEGEEAAALETATAEVEKTEQVKEVEADTSLSVEEKIAKVKELLGDDEKAINAYVKHKGYHTDPAWQKQRELIDRLKREKEENLIKQQEVDKITSSREYIESSMRALGFTKEAIDRKLEEKGFEVKAESVKSDDDIGLIARTLNINPVNLSDAQKNDIADIAKIARVIAESVFANKVPITIQPIQQFMSDVTNQQSAEKINNVMEKMVKDGGVLNFEKDVEPELGKFMDDNPEASQQEIYTYFKDFFHKATVERLKSGKRQEERDGKRGNFRQNIPRSGADTTFPDKTGDKDKDADAILDYLGVM